MFIRLCEKDTRDDSGNLIRWWGSRLNGERKLAWQYVDCRGTHNRKGDGVMNGDESVNGSCRRKTWKTYQELEQNCNCKRSF